MKTDQPSGQSSQRCNAPTVVDLSLLELIREDYVAHERDWTRPGFRALAVYRFGVWRMTRRSRLLRGVLGVIYRTAFRFCRNVYGIEVPYSAVIGRRVIIEHQGSIVVHGSAQVGDDTILRQGVTLGNRHLSQPLHAPIIGARVNIGAGAQVLGAVRVGDDAVVGANSVVIHDVPAAATVVGLPARQIDTH